MYGVDGVANDFGTASGTSMAAPYVAGTAALVREAMQFVGIQNITQDTIYNHLRNTADTLFDSVTNASYARINVQCAIDSLMPTDDYGSTLDVAQNLGSVSGERTISGAVARLTDSDYFTFTAGASGTMHLSLDTTGQLTPEFALYGASGQLVEGEVSFSVEAGRTYSFSIGTDDGIGRYNIGLDLESSFSVVDWGTVEQKWMLDQQGTASGAWYQMTATHSGLLSVEAFAAAAQGQVSISIFTADGQLLGSTGQGYSQRLDVTAQIGTNYLLRVDGQNSDVDFRLTNLIGIDGSSLTVFGTAGNDTLSYTAANRGVSVNGVNYEFAAGRFTQIQFQAGAGIDAVVVNENAGGNVSATLRTQQVSLTNGNRTVTVNDAEQLSILLTGGTGSATFFDSAGDDTLVVSTAYAELSGSGYSQRVSGFATIIAHATAGGVDRAVLYDTAGDDTFTADPRQAELRGSGYQFTVDGFDQVSGMATAGGVDRALLYDSTGNDRFESARLTAYSMELASRTQ